MRALICQNGDFHHSVPIWGDIKGDISTGFSEVYILVHTIQSHTNTYICIFSITLVETIYWQVLNVDHSKNASKKFSKEESYILSEYVHGTCTSNSSLLDFAQ